MARIEGNGQNNRLVGTLNNDEIRGRGGDDTIFGRAGHDRLRGDKGDDTLTGGTGRDRFTFDLQGGNDTVRDYTDGQDRLDFTNFNFASVRALLNQAD
jgi:Ca2+-binding RTX toxin-like protein